MTTQRIERIEKDVLRIERDLHLVARSVDRFKWTVSGAAAAGAAAGSGWLWDLIAAGVGAAGGSG